MQENAVLAMFSFRFGTTRKLSSHIDLHTHAGSAFDLEGLRPF